MLYKKRSFSDEYAAVDIGSLLKWSIDEDRVY